jgi:hypothetical protein
MADVPARLAEELDSLAGVVEEAAPTPAPAAVG